LDVDNLDPFCYKDYDNRILPALQDGGKKKASLVPSLSWMQHQLVQLPQQEKQPALTAAQMTITAAQMTITAAQTTITAAQMTITAAQMTPLVPVLAPPREPKAGITAASGIVKGARRSTM
jgi:hypothetical protein